MSEQRQQNRKYLKSWDYEETRQEGMQERFRKGEEASDVGGRREEKVMERETQERQEEMQMCWESGEDPTSFVLFPNQPVCFSIQKVSF